MTIKTSQLLLALATCSTANAVDSIGEGVASKEAMAKSQVMHTITQFLPPIECIKMQALNKRYYNQLVPDMLLIRTVPFIPMTDSMRKLKRLAIQGAKGEKNPDFTTDDFIFRNFDNIFLPALSDILIELVNNVDPEIEAVRLLIMGRDQEDLHNGSAHPGKSSVVIDLLPCDTYTEDLNFASDGVVKRIFPCPIVRIPNFGLGEYGLFICCPTDYIKHKALRKDQPEYKVLKKDQPEYCDLLKSRNQEFALINQEEHKRGGGKIWRGGDNDEPYYDTYHQNGSTWARAVVETELLVNLEQIERKKAGAGPQTQEYERKEACPQPQKQGYPGL